MCDYIVRDRNHEEVVWGTTPTEALFMATFVQEFPEDYLHLRMMTEDENNVMNIALFMNSNSDPFFTEVIKEDNLDTRDCIHPELFGLEPSEELIESAWAVIG